MKALEEFEAGYWGHWYPAITQSWRRNWQHLVPFLAFPERVRRIIYTTDDIDKPDLGFSIPDAFLCSAQVSLFLRPAHRISRAGVSRRRQGWPVRWRQGRLRGYQPTP
ncbi:transposase [Mesorhizobium sp.]|uniref:transposase n=1 Tax=Mesorhizobium sp. TaxID=1871066 RepID=UPI00257C2D0E|nr:transposase [Mesorhizobium sp.]